MYTAATIWRALELVAHRKGWSLAQLAASAKLAETALLPAQRSDGSGVPQFPSLEMVAELLAAAGPSFGEFARTIENVQRSQPNEGASEGDG